MTKSLTKLWVGLAVILIIGCLTAFYFLFSKEQPATTSAQLKIATTIFPLKDITEQIVGEKAEVISILSAGDSPHLFEFTPRQVKELSEVKTILAIGYGLDDWVLAVKNIADDISIDTVATDISLRKTNGVIDPHYWLSFTNAKQITQNIAELLSKIDPQNNEFYQDNAQKYITLLQQKEQELKNILQNIQQNKIVTYHPAWNYFADNFNLEIVGTFEPEAGQEPSPQYLANLQAIIKKNNLKVIFSEPQLSTANIATLIEDLNLQVAQLDPIGGSTETSSYLKLMEYNVKTIAKALSE